MGDIERLSIMQPYVFPYIGYFHLIEASDKIVFYDDVTYIKQGWINRNRILLQDKDFLFTIPLENASSFRLILETKPLSGDKYQEKFLGLIRSVYRKAPYYSEVYKLIESVIIQEHDNVADLAISSITAVYDYLGKEIKWTKSSTCSPQTRGMGKADRLIQITKDLGYRKYVNPIGGLELYDRGYFNSQGVELNFIQSREVPYKQFNDQFVPWLSILDILMFNDITEINKQFSAYDII